MQFKVDLSKITKIFVRMIILIDFSNESRSCTVMNQWVILKKKKKKTFNPNPLIN